MRLWMRRGAVPTGLRINFGFRLPTLKRGANDLCAHGARGWTLLAWIALRRGVGGIRPLFDEAGDGMCSLKFGLRAWRPSEQPAGRPALPERCRRYRKATS